jgi:hypothetical protein
MKFAALNVLNAFVEFKLQCAFNLGPIILLLDTNEDIL